MKESSYRERVTSTVRDAYDRANKLIDEKALADAELELRAAIEEEPGFAPAYNRLGVIAMRRGNREDARDWFDRALDQDTQYAPALTNLGNLALERGMKAEARSFLNRALDADGDYGPAHNSYGILLRQEGRLGEAVSHLRRARRGGSYHVALQDIASPGGRKGCLLVAGFILLVLAGSILLFVLY